MTLYIQWSTITCILIYVGSSKNSTLGSSTMDSELREEYGGLSKLYPLVHQQAAEALARSDEDYSLFPASPLRQSYYIRVAKSSKQIFLSISLFELSFCIFLLALSQFKRVPETSASVDFNLSRMFDNTEERIPETRLSVPLLLDNSRDFVRSLFGVRLHVQEEISGV